MTTVVVRSSKSYKMGIEISGIVYLDHVYDGQSCESYWRLWVNDDKFYKLAQDGEVTDHVDDD